MTTIFSIDLTIHMVDGGRLARKLLNMYFPDMPADINETALALCSANQAVQARKFAKLTLKRADAWACEGGSMEIFILLSVFGEDPAFIKQVLAKFIECFPDYLQKASARYFTHPSFPPDIPLQTTSWSADIH